MVGRVNVQRLPLQDEYQFSLRGICAVAPHAESANLLRRPTEIKIQTERTTEHS